MSHVSIWRLCLLLKDVWRQGLNTDAKLFPRLYRLERQSYNRISSIVERSNAWKRRCLLCEHHKPGWPWVGNWHMWCQQKARHSFCELPANTGCRFCSSSVPPRGGKTESSCKGWIPVALHCPLHTSRNAHACLCVLAHVSMCICVTQCVWKSGRRSSSVIWLWFGCILFSEGATRYGANIKSRLLVWRSQVLL